jgi:hypothetical protein
MPQSNAKERRDYFTARNAESAKKNKKFIREFRERTRIKLEGRYGRGDPIWPLKNAGKHKGKAGSFTEKQAHPAKKRN